jgi:hypothetical protein
MNTLQSTWQHASSGAKRAPRRQVRPWWRPTLVLAILAALGVGGLLLAFQQVVLQGVQRGESRNRATAAHTDGVWRCNALRTVSLRAGCRVQIDAAHADATMSYARGDVAARAVVLAER